jgi:iron complex outermembrane receptor protein
MKLPFAVSPPSTFFVGCFALMLVSSSAHAAEATEKDFFEELPVVLSVTRLAQPLNEVPGAVTVIDRETIKRIGAREVADVLRLVPGFVMTRWQGGLVPAYHAGMDIYGARMQVYVDGRSVYSSYLLGDVHLGLRGLVLADIERIEVLRGSNSAGYGSNAFLGVVNIITRNSADTHGAMVSVTQGDNAINDNVGRIGWGTEHANFRVTLSRRSDSGLNKSFDDANQARFNFRSDFRLTPKDSATVNVGTGNITYGDGTGNSGNPFRPVTVSDLYFNGLWRHELDEGSSFQFRLTHDVERFNDSFVASTTIAGTPYSAVVSANGEALRTELGGQYQTVLSENLRAVVGTELLREEIRSRALFATDSSIAVLDWRVFGNLEWRASQQWIFNVGGLQEQHGITGNTFSPRFAVSFHVLPDHTLRAVTTKSYRSPTLLDLRGDRQYIDRATGVIVPLVGRRFLAIEGVKPESIVSDEIGYFGRYRDIGLTVDVRGFVEKIKDRIVHDKRTIGTFPGTFPNVWTNVYMAKNLPGPKLRGFEYELNWTPVDGTRLMYNEAHVRRIAQPSTVIDPGEVANQTSSFTWLQTLPGGLEGSLISQQTSAIDWGGEADPIGVSRRLDVRLAKIFRIGNTRGEFAVTTQSINGGHFIFNKELKLDRRTFATLTFEY